MIRYYITSAGTLRYFDGERKDYISLGSINRFAFSCQFPCDRVDL